MDSGSDIQFTCCRESKRETPQASALAKIRSSVSPDAPGINHTSVTARRREWGWLSSERLQLLRPKPGAWHWHCVVHGRKCTSFAAFYFVSLSVIHGWQIGETQSQKFRPPNASQSHIFQDHSCHKQWLNASCKYLIFFLFITLNVLF